MSLFRILAALCFTVLAAPGFGSAIPLACHPPQLALLPPPVYPASYMPAEARRAYSAAVYCAADGSLIEIDTSTLPEDLVAPIEHALRASVFRPAQTQDTATAGFERVLFRSYFTPVKGAPTPMPRFHLDPAARNRLDTLARPIVRGWLRMRIMVNADGTIQQVQTQNKSLNAALKSLFRNDIDLSEPPFLPAMENGQPIAGAIDLFWDHTPSQNQDFEEIPAEPVHPGANPLPDGFEGPAEDLEFRAWIFPHASNRVTGAYVGETTPASLSQAFLKLAAGWLIPTRNADSPLELSLRYEAATDTLVVEEFRQIAVSAPALRFSARPQYPHRRLFPNPEGFVRVQMTVGTDGRPTDIMVLDSSHRRFREPALEALEVWHFTPMLFDENPVPARVFWTLPLDPRAR